jgi:hypothetical protein
MPNLVSLANLEELKKVLFLQKTIITQAKNELLATAGDFVEDEIQDNPIKEGKLFMEREKALLKKYVDYPTLSEFVATPSMYDGYKWGATFGVTLLVGELIFEQLKSAHPHFSPVIRQLFVLFLTELEHPQHEYLIEPLEKHLRFKITDETGGAVPADRQKAFVRDLVNQLADTIVALGESYGLIKVKKGGVAITPVGKRVLLHLLDASKFVEDMTKAHAKFQISRPKLSMT